MDYTKLPKPNLKGIMIASALGVIVAVGLYQAQVRGLIPSNLPASPKLPDLKTQTVVQEENAIISVSEKVSPSVIAIGPSE